jgi:hypothetical protein
MRKRARGRVWMAWLWGGVAAAAALVAVFGVGGRSAAQQGGFDPYIRRENGSRADPINLLFRGGDADDIARAIEDVMGWRPIEGSAMGFFDGGKLLPTAHQLGLDLNPTARFHLRIEDAAPEDGREFVLAAAHRDDSVGCGHVGRAFDDTRDLIARAFYEAGYPVFYVRLGNVAPAPHCDGSLTGGDGDAVIIDLSPDVSNEEDEDQTAPP